LLVPKARAALERYGHQVVIGNDLNRRKFEVVFVTRPTSVPASSTVGVLPRPLAASGFMEYWVRTDPDGGKEIEEDIVTELTRRHGLYIDAESPTRAV
jgi:phosphopantothenate---cysteine ligase (ATP)